MVVDSGSTDCTLAAVADHVDVVVRLPRDGFSYGRALNAGFAAAGADIVMPLSSHCWLADERHVEHALDWHARPGVAATTGAEHDPWGRRITRSYTQRSWPENGTPWWGFSNHSCSVRRSVWEEIPFDESLPACEDKDWADRALRRGHRIVYDPRLAVSSTHRRTQGLRHSFARGRREGMALQLLAPRPVLTAGYLARHRFLPVPDTARFWRPLYYVMPHRIVEVAGLCAGARRTRHAASTRPAGAGEVTGEVAGEVTGEVAGEVTGTA